VLRDGKPVLLLLEAATRGESYQWRVYSREEFEKISS
jgi:hypothetical protein